MSGKVSFINTRARIQRLSDAKLFNGWVQQLTPESATITIRPGNEIHPGDRFHCELQGKNLTGVFMGTLMVQKGDLYHFAFDKPFKTRPSVEDVRFKIRGLSGKVFRATGDLVEESGEKPVSSLFCHVVDLSMEGIGIETEIHLAQGELIILKVESCYGEFQCKAEVRYCRKNADKFRCGLHLEGMDRLNKSIYIRLLESLGY